MKNFCSNPIIVAVSNRSISFFRVAGWVFGAGLFLACMAVPLPAAVSGSGDLDPANPASWTSYTVGYIGRTSTGSITVNSGSRLNISGGLVKAKTLMMTLLSSGAGTCNLNNGGQLNVKNIVPMGGIAKINWNDGIIQ
jgi:hypothetical protein